MSDRVEFYGVGTGESFGALWIEAGKLKSSPVLASLRKAAEATFGTPREILKHYADWSNGYISSKAID